MRRLVEEVALLRGRDDLTAGHQVVPGIVADRNQSGDRTPAVGHLEALPVGHPGEVATGVLAQLAHPDAIHVLHGSTWLRLIPTGHEHGHQTRRQASTLISARPGSRPGTWPGWPERGVGCGSRRTPV